jgi:hypothetical protein
MSMGAGASLIYKYSAKTIIFMRKQMKNEEQAYPIPLTWGPAFVVD